MKLSFSLLTAKLLLSRIKSIKRFVRSCNVKIINLKDPKKQFNGVRNALIELLKEMKGYKYTQTLVVTFKKPKILKKAYFNSKPKIVINDNDIEENLIGSCEEISNRIDIWISEGSGWTIESVDQHFINFANYKPLEGSSYVELPKELQKSRKGLINIQNKDSECFR